VIDLTACDTVIRLRDAFRARLVKPPDVPQAAPELTQTITNMGGCAVNAP